MVEVNASYNLTLLREFYAEVAAAKTPKLKIRGVRFTLNGKAFNRHFNLNPLSKTEYTSLLRKMNSETLTEMSELLGRGGAVWEPHQNIMQKVYRSSFLHADSNVWMNFIRQSISPTTHVNTVSVERMLLLFCLTTGKSVNLGRIMLASVKECADRRNGKLFFAGTITNMLANKGVPQYKDDMIVMEQRDKREIDLKAVARLRGKKDQAVGMADMIAIVQELLAQNSTLMDNVLSQRNECLEKIEELREEVLGGRGKTKQPKKRAGVKLTIGPKLKFKAAPLSREMRRLIKRNRKLTREVEKLKKQVGSSEEEAAEADGSESTESSPTRRE